MSFIFTANPFQNLSLLRTDGEILRERTNKYFKIKNTERPWQSKQNDIPTKKSEFNNQGHYEYLHETVHLPALEFSILRLG